jgi:hypothetical protein
MTKTKITFGLSKCWRILSAGVLTVLLTTSAYAQTSCINEVNATLGVGTVLAPCERNLLPGELLTPSANDPAINPGAKTVFIKRGGVYPAVSNPKITLADIGQTLEVMVVNDNANVITSCWGYVKIEDKDKPVLRCPNSIAVSCLQSVEPSVTGTIKLAGGANPLVGAGAIAVANLPANVGGVGGNGWYYDCSIPATITYTDQIFESSCTAPFMKNGIAASPGYTVAPTEIGTLGAMVTTNAAGATSTVLADYNALVDPTNNDVAGMPLLTGADNNIIKVIVRTFKVTDAYGNFTTCLQVIGAKRMDNTMRIIRPLDTTFNCTSNITDFSPEGINRVGNGASWSAYPLLFIPRNGGAVLPCNTPFTSLQLAAGATTVIVGGVTYDIVQLKPGTTTCGISVTYSDTDLNLCAGSFKKLRNWRIQNWCGATLAVCAPSVTGAVVELGEQNIKNLDLSAPVVRASYVTYQTTSNYVCTRDANGDIIPETIGGVTNVAALFKRDVSAVQVSNRPFTGSMIEGSPTVIGPDADIMDITAIGNTNTCTGRVAFTLSAKDVGCTAISGQVVITTSDNRLTVTGTPVYNASTGETTISFGGDFDLTQESVAPNAVINNLDGLVVTVTVADACGYAKATQRFRILVIDNAKPQPVCIEYLQLALGSGNGTPNSGSVRLQATSLNRASTDNCTNSRNLKYLVRKMQVPNANGTALIDNTDQCFSQWVDFTCMDAMASNNSRPNNATAATINVVMRVCDEAGNYNDCMVQVLVEDKMKPTCIPPAPLNINCNTNANLWDLSNYGTPAYYDNCSATIDELPAQFALNNCKIGTITRSWVVTDKFDNRSLPCTQTINVIGISDFTVDFPDDTIASCFGGVRTAEQAKNAMLTNSRDKDGHIENNGCGVIAVEVSDRFPDASGDGSCYKVLRKYRVIDWCRYNPNNAAENVSCYGRPVLQVAGQPLVGDQHSNPNWNSAVNGNAPSWDNLHVGIAAGETSRTGDQLKERKFRDADIYNFSANSFTGDIADDLIVRENIRKIYASGVRNNSLLPTNRDHWTYADGIICFTQTIKVVDNVAPIVSEEADNLEICDYGTGGNCSARYTHTLVGTDQCEGGNGTLGLTYSWTLVRTDGLPIVPASAGVAVVMSYSGATNAIDIPSLPYDVTYKINWTLADRCGNSGHDEYEIRFRDCKKPGITCSNINAEIMPTTGNVGGGGQIEVWASEFINSIADNCAIDRNKVRVRRQGAGQGYPSPLANRAITFTCNDYTANASHTVLVEVWAVDESRNLSNGNIGNADFCLATVTLQNNMGACGPAGDVARINGGIQTEARTNVENVTVKATMNGSQLAGSVTTRTDGLFSLSGLTTAQNYAVRGERVDNPLNGVTTYDIALMSRHILGTEVLNSPFKIIAADVNGDRELNTGDMIALRRAVLHLAPTFPNNVQSWRFVNKTYAFRSATNPLAEDFPEVVNVTNAARGNNAADFIGIKVGDLNSSATANGLAGLDIRGGAGMVTLKTDDLNLVAGKTYTVQLKSDDFKVSGVQGTLNLANGYADQIAVTGQLPNMAEGNFGVFNNAVTMSWDGKANVETDVLTLTFRAKRDGKLSEILTVGSNLTYAEGYNATGESFSVNLKFNNGKVSGSEFALYQNEPNPFDGTTKIGFNLPESAKATLTIYDVTGKLVKIVEGNYTAGYNALQLTKTDMNANGVLYYRLESGNNTATKKMIIIE